MKAHISRRAVVLAAACAMAMAGISGCHRDSTPEQKTAPPAGERSDEQAGSAGQQPAATGQPSAATK